MSDDRFGFTVERDEYHGDDLWIVSLPHQCDAWSIAGDWSDGEPHAEAVTLLEAFIAEAQEALDALKSRREIESPA